MLYLECSTLHCLCHRCLCMCASHVRIRYICDEDLNCIYDYAFGFVSVPVLVLLSRSGFPPLSTCVPFLFVCSPLVIATWEFCSVSSSVCSFSFCLLHLLSARFFLPAFRLLSPFAFPTRFPSALSLCFSTRFLSALSLCFSYSLSVRSLPCHSPPAFCSCCTP